MAPINYKGYPPNWEDLRKQVLKRANNRCEHKGCGLMHNEIVKRSENCRHPNLQEWDWVKDYRKKGFSFTQAIKKLGFTRIILTIAHLDNDPHNWQVKIERLKALCQKHHLELDKKIHAENRKYGRNYRNNNLKLDL